MRTTSILFLTALTLVVFSHFCFAGEFDEEPGSFVSFEAGKLILLGKSADVANHPTILYFNIGFPINQAFGNHWKSKAFTVGPKLGFGFGSEKTGAADSTATFFEALANARFMFGNIGETFRTYVELASGVGTFTGAAVQIEGGGGLNVFFDSQSSFGVSTHYREIIGSEVKRGVSILGSLAYHF